MSGHEEASRWLPVERAGDSALRLLRFHRLTGFLALAVMTGSATLYAAEFPARAVRMIVPFTAGGPTDLIGRLVAQQMSEAWKMPVLVDNRGGAGGTIGVEIAIKASADGHTLLFGSTSTFAVNPALFPKLGLSMASGLQLVGFVAYAPQVMVVRGTLAVESVPDLVALARRQPGKLTFASAGVGTTVHLAGELLKHAASIDVLHVPFKGGGQAITSLLTGEVDILFNNPGALMPHIKSGKLKVLAIAGPQRTKAMPQIPTFAEVGLPQVESGSAFGIAVPARTPATPRQRISAVLEAMVQIPAYVEQLGAFGTDALFMGEEAAQAYVRRESAKWKDVIKAAKVTVD
ncbi:MAG: Bug family tripartite tricarboxylate transporter substrate binding protein [bacterium]|jgi:tripartite-type tricarboxylate transporter receptor subunit TctC|nr:tripartite tricarboxylate transporter substrate binding protein [Betaproteobacteria bacterium]